MEKSTCMTILLNLYVFCVTMCYSVKHVEKDLNNYDNHNSRRFSLDLIKLYIFQKAPSDILCKTVIFIELKLQFPE